jgi:hypothetical protein
MVNHVNDYHVRSSMHRSCALFCGNEEPGKRPYLDAGKFGMHALFFRETINISPDLQKSPLRLPEYNEE